MHIPFLLILAIGLVVMFVIALITIGAFLGLVIAAVLGAGFVLFLLAQLVGFIRYVLSKLRPRKYQTVIAEYETPQLLEPAELGYLFDTRSEDQEFLATLLSLVQKGVIKMEFNEYHNPLFSWEGSYTGSITDIEAYALAWVRKEKYITWKELSRGIAATIGPRISFEEGVKQSLVHKGYITLPRGFSLLPGNPAFFIAWLMTAIGALVIIFMRLNGSEGVTQSRLDRALIEGPAIFLLVMLWPAYVQFITWAYRHGAHRPFKITEKGRAHWADIAGYQLFLRTVEFGRLQADPRVQDPVLPYCVALGYKPDLDKIAKSK